MVPRKGIDTVIRSFARVIREHRIDARLVIVGGSTRVPDPSATPEIGRLMSVAAAENVAGRVLFRGRADRDELKYYYSAADIFVTTPWYEPFGITPLESMACGTPVIGSNVGGIRFSVKDGKTGFLVPPQDPAALSRQIVRLYRDPALRRTMGREAMRRARDMFTWKTITDIVIEFYRKAMASESGDVIDDERPLFNVSRAFHDLGE